MLYNKNLAEKPDHAHYPVCLGRMTTINDSCHKFFRDALVANGGLVILTIFGQYIPVISLISTQFGVLTDVRVMFIEWLMITGISVMTGFACGKRKYFNIIALVLYAMMAIGGLIHNDKIGGAASFLICTTVVAMNLKMFMYCFEYNQLSKTEGFPLFNERLSEYDQNNITKNMQTPDDYTAPSAPITSPTVAAVPSVPDNGSSTAVMPEMPALGAVPFMPAADSSYGEDVWTKLFAPNEKKESRFSESPIKNI